MSSSESQALLLDIPPVDPMVEEICEHRDSCPTDCKIAHPLELMAYTEKVSSREGDVERVMLIVEVLLQK